MSTIRRPSRGDLWRATANEAIIPVCISPPGQGQGGTADLIQCLLDRGMPGPHVKAGNRLPGTVQPTTLDGEQRVREPTDYEEDVSLHPETPWHHVAHVSRCLHAAGRAAAARPAPPAYRGTWS